MKVILNPSCNGDKLIYSYIKNAITFDTSKNENNSKAVMEIVKSKINMCNTIYFL